MVQESVTHGRLVDVARLGVADTEVFVAAMAICSLLQIRVKCVDMIYQITLKHEYVVLASFAPSEFLPRGEQVLDRDDIVIGMSELPSRTVSPPLIYFLLFFHSSK